MRFYQLCLISISLFFLSCQQEGSSSKEKLTEDSYATIRMQINQISNQLEERRDEVYQKYVDLRMDETVTDFDISYLNGSSAKLSDYKGKVVLIDFWATWCGPCKLISPYIAKIKKKYAGSDLVVIGLSYENKSTVDEFAKKNEHHYDLAYNGMDAQRALRVRSFPSIYIFDRDGKLQYMHPGVRTDSPKAIEWQVDYLLKQSAEP